MPDKYIIGGWCVACTVGPTAGTLAFFLTKEQRVFMEIEARSEKEPEKYGDLLNLAEEDSSDDDKRSWDFYDWQIMLKRKKREESSLKEKWFNKLTGEDPTNWDYDNDKNKFVEGINKMKKECIQVLIEVFNDDQEEAYKTAVDWCTQPLTVEDRLKRDGKTILKNQENDTTDDSKWKSKISTYKTEQEKPNKDNPTSIEGVKVNGTSGKEDEDVKVLKKACREVLTHRIMEVGTPGSERHARTWCTDSTN